MALLSRRKPGSGKYSKLEDSIAWEVLMVCTPSKRSISVEYIRYALWRCSGPARCALIDKLYGQQNA